MRFSEFAHRFGKDLAQVILYPDQPPLHYGPRLRRHQIPERIRRIISADAFFIGIHLQHIFRPMRIMLQCRQALQQPPAPPMNEPGVHFLRMHILLSPTNFQKKCTSAKMNKWRKTVHFSFTFLIRDQRIVKSKHR
jgi:hypothetical protein